MVRRLINDLFGSLVIAVIPHHNSLLRANNLPITGILPKSTAVRDKAPLPSDPALFTSHARRHALAQQVYPFSDLLGFHTYESNSERLRECCLVLLALRDAKPL